MLTSGRGGEESVCVSVWEKERETDKIISRIQVVFWALGPGLNKCKGKKNTAKSGLGFHLIFIS